MTLFVLEMTWSYIFIPLQAMVVVVRVVTMDVIKITKDTSKFIKDRPLSFQIPWTRVD